MKLAAILAVRAVKQAPIGTLLGPLRDVFVESTPRKCLSRSKLHFSAAVRTVGKEV